MLTISQTLKWWHLLFSGREGDCTEHVLSKCHHSVCDWGNVLCYNCLQNHFFFCKLKRKKNAENPYTKPNNQNVNRTLTTKCDLIFQSFMWSWTAEPISKYLYSSFSVVQNCRIFFLGGNGFAEQTLQRDFLWPQLH